MVLATHEEAAGALKTAGDTVELVVQYRPDGNCHKIPPQYT